MLRAKSRADTLKEQRTDGQFSFMCVYKKIPN